MGGRLGPPVSPLRQQMLRVHEQRDFLPSTNGGGGGGRLAFFPLTHFQSGYFQFFYFEECTQGFSLREISRSLFCSRNIPGPAGASQLLRVGPCFPRPGPHRWPCWGPPGSALPSTSPRRAELSRDACPGEGAAGPGLGAGPPLETERLASVLCSPSGTWPRSLYHTRPPGLGSPGRTPPIALSNPAWSGLSLEGWRSLFPENTRSVLSHPRSLCRDSGKWK